MADAGVDLTEDTKLLPIANIARIMKKALPLQAKMSKEAKLVVQEAVTALISLVVCEASDRTTIDERRTISGDDGTFTLLLLL